MAGTRALFASIGASVVLIAAAALSLLAVSAVFAFGGWGDHDSADVTRPALVFAGSDLPHADPPQVAAIVAPAPERKTQRRRDSRSQSTGSGTSRSSVRSGSGIAATGGGAVQSLNPPAVQPGAAVPGPAAKKTGDAVREVGDSLGSTVDNGANGVAQVTQPLAPPVSTAVEQVLEAVEEIVRRSTNDLGATLDTLPAAK